MDARTGQLYPSLDAAIADGVPREHAVEVDVVEIKNGPFKGRKYQRLSDGRLGKRVYDDARAKRP